MYKIFLRFLLGLILCFTISAYSQIVCPLGNTYSQISTCGVISPTVSTVGAVSFCVGDSIGLTTSSLMPVVDSVWICWGDGITSVSNGHFTNPIYHDFDFPADSCLCNGNNSTQLQIAIAFYKSCPPNYSYDTYLRPVTLKFKPRPKFITIPTCPYSNANISIPPCRQACANGSISDTTKVIWDMGNGDIVNMYSTGSTIPTPVYEYHTPGTYAITLYLNNGLCGNASYQDSIKILPNTILNPTLVAGPYCAPGDISLNDIHPYPQSNFTWAISPVLPGVIITDSTLLAHVNSPGNYLVTIKALNGCCTAPQSICIWDSSITFGTAPILNQVINYNTSCDPVSVNFSNSFVTTASDNHLWQIDSLSGSTLFNIYSNTSANPPSVLLSNIGTYILTAISTNACSSDTLKDTLQISGPTTFSPILGNISSCAPDSITVISGGTVNASGISWTSSTISGGIISPASTSVSLPVFHINAAGTYSINGIATGCCTQPGSDCSFNQLININQLPLISQILNYGDSCNSSTISFANNFSSSYSDSVHWEIDSLSGPVNFPIYNSNSSAPADLILNTSGVYVVSLIAYNDCALPNGIALRDTFSILSPTIISPQFQVTMPLCAPDSVVILSTNAQNATSFSWTASSLSGGNIFPVNSTSSTPVFQISAAGSYEIKLEATGCCTAPSSICSMRDTFNFKQAPVLSQILSIADHCDSVANYLLHFSDYFNFQSQSGDLGYLWKVIDQASGNIIWSTSTSVLPDVPIAAYGNYLITASAWNTCDSIVLKDTFRLSSPGLLLLPSDTLVCKNSANILFNATPAGGNWTLNTIAVAGGVFSPMQITQPYNYLVYTVGTNECQLKDSIKIIVSGAEVTAGSDVNYCDNEGLDTLHGSPANGIWSGAGIINNTLGTLEPDSIHLSPSIAVYTVTDSVCVTADTLVVNVFNSPSSQPLWPDTLCVNELFSFINPSVLFIATWDFGDGSSIAAADTINKSFATTGNYLLQVTFTTTQNCSKIFTHQLYISEPPVADFSLTPDSICFGDSVLLKNNNPDSAFTSYYWTYGILPADTIYNPGFIQWTNKADSILNIIVLLEAKNRCGVQQMPDTFFVKPFPNAKFDVHQNTGCSPDTVSISNVSVGNPKSYEWYLDNVFLSGDSSLSPIILTADSIDTHYTLSLIVTNECSKDTLTRDIIVGPPKPVPFFNLDLPYGCAPLKVMLTSSVQANSFISWNFGDGNIGIGDTVTHIFNSPGTYEITQYAAGCGTDSIKQFATAFDIPPVSFDVNPVNCVNKPVKFKNTSPGLIGGVWDFGDGSLQDSSGLNPSHQYVVPGIYTVTLKGYGTPSSPGISCENISRSLISIVDKPQAIVSVTDNAGCFPFNLQLSVINLSRNANRYDWYFGNGDTIRGNLINTYTYYQSGSFPLTLIAYDNNNCSDTTHFNYINVFPEIKPVATFEAEPNDQSILNPVIDLHNYSTNAFFYEWNFGDNTFSNLFEPLCIYKETGRYKVTLTVENNFGCRDSVVHPLTIRPALSMYVPNAFTPGGINPVFKPEFTSVSLTNYLFTIFNRWGDKVFETSNINEGWTGTFKGKESPVGVYIYIVKAKRLPLDNADPQDLKFKGQVTLLR